MVDRLSSRYGVPGWEVRMQAEMIYASYREAPIRAFVPILVEKALRDWLRHGRANSG
ncbi:MAG: three-helix bundle dimerization domain-containing protein [Pseudonocardiaceae bacterium]